MTPKDLSLAHEPVSDLFEQPQSPQEWQRYQLKQSQIDFFNENGYLAGVRILSDEQVNVLRTELAQLVDPNHPSNNLFYEYHSNETGDPKNVLFHALGAWRITPGFHDLLWAPAFRMAAYQLLGGAYRQFHDQLFCKPAGHGGVVAWHQDYSYWTWTQPMSHLSCWIGLDDSTVQNGCVYYVPGSHKWGLLPITGLAGDMDAVREVLTEKQAKTFDSKVAVELKSGEASFHHPLSMHGSYENRSDKQRRATVINVLSDGVRSNAEGRDWSDSKGYHVPAQGEPIAGQFYPMLFDPDIELAKKKGTVVTV